MSTDPGRRHPAREASVEFRKPASCLLLAFVVPTMSLFSAAGWFAVYCWESIEDVALGFGMGMTCLAALLAASISRRILVFADPQEAHFSWGFVRPTFRTRIVSRRKYDRVEIRYWRGVRFSSGYWLQLSSSRSEAVLSLESYNLDCEVEPRAAEVS